MSYAGSDYTATERVSFEVISERERQDMKWGEQNHPDGTGPERMVLRWSDVNLDLRTGSELAEIFRLRCDRRFRENAAGHVEGTWFDILLEEVFEASGEEDVSKLRMELIQVAAVATAWVEAIDRRAK